MVKRFDRESYDKTKRFVADSLGLLQFCRSYLGAAPDNAAPLRRANLMAPAPLAALDDQAVELARSSKGTRRAKLCVDGVVAAITVDHPTKPTRAAVVGGGSALSALTCPIPLVRPRARH
jgi:hypothetical protein